MALNRDAIVKKIGSRKTVRIEALDGEVILKELSAKEVMDLTDKHERGEMTLNDLTLASIIACVMDENDEPLFDLPLLNSLSMVALNELAEAVAVFNGMKVQLEKAKDDLKKVRANAS